MSARGGQMPELRSPKPGSYDLSIPMGIPAAVPEIVSVRNGKLKSVKTEKFDYPPVQHIKQ